jgi:flagellar basal-body rod modification protein FlgD
MTVSAMWNQGMAGTNPLTYAKPMNSGQGSSAASSNEASVSANDFLTLLVTEMKNQDPTASTDPNEYINQLVQVNSLEQLISINQNLSTALGTSATASSRASSPEPIADSQPTHNAAGGSRPGSAADGVPGDVVSGNLSIPQTSSAAQRVGHALGGRHQASHV